MAYQRHLFLANKPTVDGGALKLLSHITPASMASIINTQYIHEFPYSLGDQIADGSYLAYGDAIGTVFNPSFAQEPLFEYVLGNTADGGLCATPEGDYDAGWAGVVDISAGIDFSKLFTTIEFTYSGGVWTVTTLTRAHAQTVVIPVTIEPVTGVGYPDGTPHIYISAGDSYAQFSTAAYLRHTTPNFYAAGYPKRTILKRSLHHSDVRTLTSYPFVRSFNATYYRMIAADTD